MQREIDRPFSVLFVCTGNICRSPLAEALLRHKLEERGIESRFHLDSCGISAEESGNQADSRMRSVAKKHGITINHRARVFARSEFDAWDLIVVMDKGHERRMLRLAPTEADRAKIVMMRSFESDWDDEVGGDVPDPWYGGIDGFHKVYEMIDRACETLADQLEAGSVIRNAD